MSNLGKPGIYNESGNGSIPIVPEGVLFKWPNPLQYTIYRNGDEGWRNQNGLLEFNPPAFPAAVAELDWSIGQNGWFQLLNPLVVGGESNTLRFVDVDGLQNWGATGNVNLITIDKLTGLGFLRSGQFSGLSWEGNIDAALAYSTIVKGITYDSFFMMSMPEAEAIFNYVNPLDKGRDPITNKVYFTVLNDMVVSTTYFLTPPLLCYMLTETWGWTILAKLNLTKSTIYVFDARSLISAPVIP